MQWRSEPTVRLCDIETKEHGEKESETQARGNESRFADKVILQEASEPYSGDWTPQLRCQ